MAPQSVPTTLPPSIEEAYRRKCVQLRNRTKEVEESNDAARLRLARIKRQVEKMRIERAFLLEQLAKRTSTNVEDSEGSPSPPPTDAAAYAQHKNTRLDANPRKPKDKPLRIKRGHRKLDAADAKPASPHSETSFQPAAGASSSAARANGTRSVSNNPSSAFELYCREKRPAVVKDSAKDPDANVDDELRQRWKDLPDAERDEFQAKLDKQQSAASPPPADEDDAEVDKDRRKGSKTPKPADTSEPQDEDVEMANYDTEDQDTQMDKDGEN